MLRLFVLLILLLTVMSSGYKYAQASLRVQEIILPTIKDPNLKAELVAKGLHFPTSMAFLGANDILVLEKDNGTVRRIVNGVIQPKPVLDVSVANKIERGMLGIAIAPKHGNKPTYAFLYYTESKTKYDGSDDCPNTNHCKPGNEPLGNRLYRYEFANNSLLNPKLLLDLPAIPGPAHNGGVVKIGPDHNVYLTIGDVRRSKVQVDLKKEPDGRSGILRVNQNGQPVQENGSIGILGHKFPLNLYYGYGLRNSFGIGFDPVSKKLWDTENGPSFGDEINIVKPGFNSGWNKIQGIWLLGKEHSMTTTKTTHPHGIVKFGGKGKYSPPEFVWNQTAGPTAIKFLNSDKIGKRYVNYMFVGDFHNGYLYHFDLNKNRTELSLKKPLEDKVANSPNELKKGGIIFGKGFGGISDLEIGPDGYLYVVSIGEGAIFRIVPTTLEKATTASTAMGTTTNTTTTNQDTSTTANESESNTPQEEQQQQSVNTNNNNNTNGTSPPSTSTTNKISIVQGAYIMTDKAFSPNPGTVKVGDTVTWTNDDDQPHTVTSGTGSDDPNKGKAFDSGPSALDTKGKTFQHKFTEAGQYSYFCELHPMMVGKIIVSSSSS